MEITEIKSQLSISTILHYYGLKPDKSAKMCCPFHEDKTPSMQVYYKTQTAYCFSSNCKTHGKSIDVIDFIMHKESVGGQPINKHQAILKAQEIINPSSGNLTVSREQFLTNMFTYFRNAINNSRPAKEYLDKRGLDFTRLEIGYNSAQFHHGERKTEELLKQALEVGLLQDKGLINSRTGEKGYSPFAKWCLCFALRNQKNQVTGMYFRSILNDDKYKHYYLKDRKGIYPGYPKSDTKKLILTEAIIDCASLLQMKEISDNYSLISCFGANGITEEITEAISQLKELEEIVFCFDNDDAGKKAVKKYAEEFKNYKVSTVELPSKDVNETLQLHDENIFIELLEKRKDIFVESLDTQLNKKPAESVKPASEPKAEPKTSPNLSVIDFLEQKSLLKPLNQLIEKAGIIGEENSRMLLFLIIISYLNKNPLHALVQGSSGSGKTHIISRIADLMPQEDVLRFTRITESSLYNWGEFDLFQKIIIIEDLDGLKEDALYALREFISNQVLRSSVTIKDKKGNNKSSHKIVKGQFSSLSATTKGETYEDNMSRSFLLAVDESKEQTQRIIQYQNRRNAGEVSSEEQQKAVGFIQKLVRNLKYYEVINPYATKLNLPDKVHKIRRLNEMYQSVIKQVTFLNQYQREIKNNYLITDIADIEQATEVLFESIVLKVDELDGSLRQFFEKLKKFIKSPEKDFIQREIRQEFNLSKTQLQRYINTLLELEYIKQVGGYNNTGIRYKVSYWDNYQKLRTEIKEYLLKQICKIREDEKTIKNTEQIKELKTNKK